MKPLFSALFCLLLFAVNGQDCTNRDPTVEGQCADISGLDCANFYPQSYFPNNLTVSVVTGVTQLQSYQRFFSAQSEKCSEYLDVFLCLAMLPVCEMEGSPGNSSAVVRMPCRAFCNRVYSDCLSVIQSLGGAVIDPLCVFADCNRYPLTDCVTLNDVIVVRALQNTPEPTGTTDPSQGRASNETCPPSDRTFFSDDSKQFALGWIAFWAVFCFISTILTLLTFILDTSRFHYPWRPVIYLALTFNIHSVGYFLALMFGRNLTTCPRGEFVQTSVSWHWGHTPCIIVFGLLYYTMIAAFLWWLVLTFCWFLASVFKWSNESIGHFAPFYHVISWVVPLLMTITLVAARVVSADELTATCFIVRDENSPSFLALLLGVILPLIVVLVVGVVFLIVGFVSMIRIRTFMRHGGKERESVILGKLMIRIGIFVTVYIIPATVVISCFIYELSSRPRWKTVRDTTATCPDCERPNTAVFMVRILMFLLIGVLTGVWIWSRKTLNTWKSLPKRLQEKFGTCAEVGAPASTPGPVSSIYMESADSSNY